MRTIIYISGISGAILLAVRMIGSMLEFQWNNLFLILGLILLMCVFLPLILMDKYRQNKKIKSIIDSYKGSDKNKLHVEKGDSTIRRWGMNDSPFRERRSGLSWGGGNIKGANASRGTRKSFLK